MRALRFTLIATLMAFLAITSPSLANLDSSEATATAAEIDRAIAAEPTAPPAIELGNLFDAPEVGSQELELDSGVEMHLPIVGAGVTVDGTTIYDATGTGEAQIAVQEAAGGVRALVTIESEGAPERYVFPVAGDVASLTDEPDGSVTARNAFGMIVGSFAPAWARDAAGRSVPTHYEISGTSLTQVIDHRGGGYAYTVVADPWWVPVSVAIIRCQANRYCAALMNRSFWRGVKWALEHLF